MSQSNTAPLDTGALVEAAGRLGISLGPAELELYRRYADLLVLRNRAYNLTSITDPAGIAIRHIADSLALAAIWQPAAGNRVVDVGAGAGFPGLVLKILWPHIRLTLLESVGKKAGFLAEAVEQLGLAGVTVLAERAEDAARRPGMRGEFDLAVARAVSSLPVLAELLLPFCAVGGAMVAYKSGDAAREMDTARGAFRELGGGEPVIHPVDLPALSGHVLIQVPKVQPTPEKYPRRAGMPAKKPLLLPG